MIWNGIKYLFRIKIFFEEIAFTNLNFKSIRIKYRVYLPNGMVLLSKRLDKGTVLLCESSLIKLFRIKVRILILNQKYNNLL